jgi:hypothetical protein
MPHNPQLLTFEEILPLLTSTYEAGRLVPFIGAGMSRKKLADWGGFVKKLEAKAKLPPLEGPPLEVRAQRAAEKIKNSSNGDDFLTCVRESLEGEEFQTVEMPPQTAALAAIYWPLTVSTNYDDLFYNACRARPEVVLEPMILGRSARDCKCLMSTLVSPFDREIIWHIQGFLGGSDVELCPLNTPQDPGHLDALWSELVIGHSEYRQVANTAVHFRRCFGEVFRSRSFLFLGSSLKEDYFLNLFGEMLELVGPGSVPHFAFVEKNEEIDDRYLAELNITVFKYDGHASLPQWLGELKSAIAKPSALLSHCVVELENHSILETARHCRLSMPDGKSDAVAIIVQSCPEGRFEIDQEQKELRAGVEIRPFEAGRRVCKLAEDVFAIRARTSVRDEHDVIGRALQELFEQLRPDCEVLHLHLPSLGGTVPPVYGYIEVIRAFGNWTKKNGRSLRMIAHAGPQVWLNLTSRQIDMHELLTSGLIRFWTVVNPAISFGGRTGSQEHRGEPVRRVFYKTPCTPLRDILSEILGEIENEALRNWSISLSPSPRRDEEHRPPANAYELADKGLSDIGVVFGSVLGLQRVVTPGKTVPPATHQAVVG